MRILVTGANGTVGSYAKDVFHGHTLTLTDRDEWDVTDRKAWRVHYGGQVNAVVHLAAATDVDACELDPDLAYRTNAIGTQNVAETAWSLGVPLVYVSTAGVFGGDGSPGPFTEFDPPCPANVYGHSKLAGERLAWEQTRRLYVVRAGWMFGGDPLTDPKFVGKMARRVGSGAVSAVANIGSPTYARDLLVGIRTMLEQQWPYGTYHMANQGVCSRYDMAAAIIALMGADCVLYEASPAEFPLPAARADSEAMESYKARLLGLPVMRPWQEALAEHLGSTASIAA